MKKIILSIISFLMLSVNICNASDTMKLTAGISIDDVPKALYGNWRVVAKLKDSNSYGTFKPQNVDIWNLTRINDEITLSNPFSGANATISIETVEGNLIIFSKKTPYGDKMLSDTISIRLNNNTFSGINTLTLETLSQVDKHSLKKENATYIIKGEKISGDSILKD